MERIQLINKLDQLHHMDWRPYNKIPSIPHLELIKPQMASTVVQQEPTYQHVTRLTQLVLG
jgi:hypothetical protein